MVSLTSVGKWLGFRHLTVISSSRRMAQLCAVFLGLILVYGAGFAQTEVIHNGAHDARHSAGFPCH